MSIYFFQGYPLHELSSFLFFFFPMCILVVLYIRMGLRIRQTSEIQRNLPRSTTANSYANCATSTVGVACAINGVAPGGAPPAQGQNNGAVAAGETESKLTSSKRAVLRMLGEDNWNSFTLFISWCWLYKQLMYEAPSH